MMSYYDDCITRLSLTLKPQNRMNLSYKQNIFRKSYKMFHQTFLYDLIMTALETDYRFEDISSRNLQGIYR